ncbi:hypothetical protein [Pseudanabaena yagii]|uniref:CopG-like ribbon-helix-helix domain-containing protein n=1 Tax=Pseudanabaena yagii GIHE-NHR1 TaxID=2722753 RepID=A0ABX1LXZ7_9CYAN|nr:hypothetical protein [Pseudanabaena yagii]NMF59831.1 hypothetical protein [Pseudanabaena yagii GIHE-NHR1]
MESLNPPPTNSLTNHSLTIEIPSELYTALLAKVSTTGKTETELVIQGLQYILEEISQQNEEEDRFLALELNLERKLKQYVESLIKDRVSSSESSEYSPKDNLAEESDSKRAMPIPTIRPLQVGDRVLILEPDSPYYMAKLSVIKTSLIRATVETDSGEKTFLKRDLRFVEAASE